MGVIVKEYVEFRDMTKEQAQEYFEWYVEQIESHMERLKSEVCSEVEDMRFDYSPESLIPLWTWYEGKIKLIERTEDEISDEEKKYPEWMHAYIDRTKISLYTLRYCLDVALYFAEVIIRSCNGKIYWGYFTKPKNRMSVNEPTLLGFKNKMDLEPRLVVLNCTRRSSREAMDTRLYDMYHTWMEYVE